jgi:LysR family transcriptional regulator for metE and metH
MKAIHAKVATRNLDRIHLQIVREVDRQGSMTAAATTLHLTQSALSHAVRKLEAALGASLWLREGRRLRPTEAGQYLLDVANHVLPQLEHAESSLRQMARGTRGTLRIGMECHPCYQWLLKVVAQYLPQWPDVDVDVKQRFRFGGISALLDHEIDLLVTPDPEPRPGLLFEPVFDYEQVLVVPAGASPGEAAACGTRAACRRSAHHLSGGHRPARHLHAVPESGRRHAARAPDAGIHRPHPGDGGLRARRGCAASLAGGRTHEERAIAPVRLGRAGVPKKIHLGLREGDLDRAWFKAFMQVARRRR